MSGMKERKTVPIVFAVNNDYTYYGYIAIYSLVKHANSNTEYRVYVFVTDVEIENQKLLESLSCGNIIVKCIDISDYTKDVLLKKSIHLSIETYYRLFIPIVLPQYQRIVYLDSDICVLDDVAKLYDCELNNSPIGAVGDVWTRDLQKHSIDIGNLDYKKTFNAGVLVIDTKRFEEERVREKCLVILQEDYKRDIRKLLFADQDALNIVLYEKASMLDDAWNVQSQYSWRLEVLAEDYKDKYLDLLDNAKILHFAGDRKPWMNPMLPKSDAFWDIARESGIFRELIGRIIDSVRMKSGKLDCFDRFQFPYSQVPFGRRIAIYGAGAVGRAFFEQTLLTKYAVITLWVDKNAKSISNPSIYSANELMKKEFEYLVIAIDDEKVAFDIRNDLISMGIAENKIVWNRYLASNNR